MNATPANILEGTVNPDTGTAPDRRFINPKDKADGSWVYEQVRPFQMCGGVKDRERAEVEAMLRFAPPYSEEDLRALNLENAPNTTLGELPRRISQAESTWTDFVTSNSGLWKVTFPSMPGEVADTMSEQVSELINHLWSEDPRHCLSLQLAFRQFSTYGIGPLAWIDCYDPSPIARTASSIKFPASTRLTLDNFTECALHDTMTAQALYGLVRGEVGKQRSKIHGWSRSEVSKVLKAHATWEQHVHNPMWSSLESVELAERQGQDLWTTYAKKDIHVIHVWVCEYEENDDGKRISYMLLANDGVGWRIIRDKDREYADPSEFMVLATDRVGSDMTIAGLRGLGVDLLEHARSTDILHCAGLYAAYRSSIPLYATNGGAGANSADQVSVRPNGVVIPQGFTETQSQVDAQAAGYYIDRLTNNADTFQGVYAINAPNKGGKQRTAREATFDAAKEADVRSSQILPMTRTFFEPLGREFLRRLFLFPKDRNGKCLKYPGWKMAQKFWDKVDMILMENGVPLIFLQDHKVVINPANTPGGLDKKLMRHQFAMSIYPTLQTQQQRNWVTNQGLIAVFGHQASKPYLNQDEPAPPSEVVTVLDGENADLVGGFQRRVLPEQDHLRHLGPLAVEGVGHIPYAMQMLQRIQSGQFGNFVTDQLEELGDQLKAAVAMQGHIAAHLAMLSQNPIILDMPEVQGYFDFNAQFEQIIVQSIKSFEQMAAERAPQGGDPKTAAVMAKTQAEIQAMQAKTQAEIQMTQQKHLLKLGNQAQTQQARHDMKNSQFILDEIIKQKNAQADLTIKAAQATLGLQAEKARIELQEEAAEAASDSSDE